MEPLNQETSQESAASSGSAFARFLSWIKSRATVSIWQAAGAFAVLVLAFMTFFDIRVTPRYRLGNTPLDGLETGAASAESVPSDAGEGDSALISQVLPVGGFVLPIRWGDLGKQLVDSGVIDQAKLSQLYADRGGVAPNDARLLAETNDKTITITAQNSGFLLNLFWALGLGNKNDILDKGPMQEEQYGGAAGFASTGGWTLAKGATMDHYSQHRFATLTSEEQAAVERVAKNIYRPCCGNSTYFPDCNHGMAMLGLLELMASQGASEPEMYRAALAVNSFWFPDTYATIAKYFENRGRPWSAVNPKDALSFNYSSGPGYRQIATQVTPPTTRKQGGGCGV